MDQLGGEGDVGPSVPGEVNTLEDTIFGLAPDEGALERVKEMKIKLPLRHHMKLHSLKLIQGKGISDAITEALDLYFEDPLEAESAVEGGRVEEEVALEQAE